MNILDYFKIEKSHRKGLMAFEWAVLIYLLFTTALLLWLRSEVVNPLAMLTDRAMVAVATVVAWGAYRIYPSRLMMLVRVVVQMGFLAIWYPDTYEFNRLFANLDHVFAGWEQTIFGCQPSLLFAKAVPYTWFSEAMCLGYAAYYPMIAATAFFAFFWRYDKFAKTSFIILGAFFVYYVIFIFLPVAGPQYYYPAAGMGNIANGIFPDLGNYFHHMRDALPTPGESGEFFRQMVVNAHNAGERPTAAFPSSHVGITTILLIIACRLRSKGLFCILLPLYILMCFATVYIYAHYAIDVIGGWISAAVIYLLLSLMYDYVINE